MNPRGLPGGLTPFLVSPASRVRLPLQQTNESDQSQVLSATPKKKTSSCRSDGTDEQTA